jgi:hypothetical protein
MPRASKTNPKVDEDSVYVAIESFAGEVAELGHEVTVQRGQRLCGSSPVGETLGEPKKNQNWSRREAAPVHLF